MIAGTPHKITDIMNHFGIDFEGKIGSDGERLDNKANVEILNKYDLKT